MNLSQLKNRLKSQKTSEQPVVLAQKESILSQECFRQVPGIEEFRVQGLDSVFYVPDFIGIEGEQVVNTQLDQQKEYWHDLRSSQRRVQVLGGKVTGQGLEQDLTLHGPVRQIVEQVVHQQMLPRANHVLVNEYQDGIGIMPHTDGPLYFPHVAILSLGSSAMFHFYKDYSHYKQSDRALSLLLEPRSLLIFKEDAYHHYLHCIEDNRVDTLFLKVAPKGDQCQIRNSNVDNLQALALAQEIEGRKYQEVEREWSRKGEEVEREWSRKGEGVDMKEHLRKGEEEQLVEMEVHLRRSRRVSLTMRWVEPKW